MARVPVACVPVACNELSSSLQGKYYFPPDMSVAQSTDGNSYRITLGCGSSTKNIDVYNNVKFANSPDQNNGPPQDPDGNDVSDSVGFLKQDGGAHMLFARCPVLTDPIVFCVKGFSKIQEIQAGGESNSGSTSAAPRARAALLSGLLATSGSGTTSRHAASNPETDTETRALLTKIRWPASVARSGRPPAARRSSTSPFWSARPATVPPPSRGRRCSSRLSHPTS